ncbi:hypothetical protein BTJ39_12315 [Izhakiella australiensis]|uniref:HTH arsR-type domain-containing protein n=1 Tax=Izhakiella australiensis TaxID=1926881 RepID=A0A1S8YL97_9GAMM|nr:metalloregulator ArsR/SmtB family transcription factor [Izhakiella australiensis]OON39810.1 hypothetical protein BTJ39_12315 [Izhakiella australiensis]
MAETRGNNVAMLLRLLGHPVRLHIALLLHQQPQTVSMLEAQLNIRQPTISQHLAVLREAGMLFATREAKSVTYAVSDGLPARLLSALAALQAQSSSEHSVVTPAKSANASRPGDELVFATLKYSDQT